MASKYILRQLFDEDTWTYTYLIADSKTKKGILIDTVLEQVDRDLKLIKELGIDLAYILETHTHADHITGAYKLKLATGAQTVTGVHSGVTCSDKYVDDGDEFSFGDLKVKAISTPGHTDGCTSYLIEDMIFVGDVLLVRGTGRTDFQQGSPEKMYESITNKLYSLPDETIIYPGHDYNGHLHSTVLEEKNFNPRVKVGTTLEQFVKTMTELKLEHPKKINEAVPANLNCGQL